ncbi:N-acetyltransferase, partial [Mycobacterium sp. ITM-2017-0098]
TEIDEAFGGRGLATILVGEALESTRADGLRIVPVCSMVAGYLKKHSEFNDVVDPVTTDVKRVLSAR